MKIKFCGAARVVTGSSHLVELDNGFKILLDCGLYQGGDKEMADFNRNWYYEPSEIDVMILSHAHIDHSGRVPKLYKDGFRQNIHCTHATKSLCAIMLRDSAKIQQSDAAYATKLAKRRNKSARKIEPLYESQHAYAVMNQFVGHGYDKWFRISNDVDVMFKDSGHILGSASVTLRVKENGDTKILAFSGDIGRPNRPILRDPQPMPEADYVICESTYGNRLHEEAPAESDRFLKIITEACVEKRGKLIIPAFSVGRTQEIVYMLDRMETEELLPPIDVYVDSPLAVNATVVFGTHPECYDEDLHDYLLIDDNPFGFNKLKYINSVEESKQINKSKKPCIIISAAGMMNAGRIQHHLYNNIESPKNTILVVGYCSPYTVGGDIIAGKKAVRLFGEYKQVLAKVEIMDSFSAHGDRDEMREFLSNQRKRCRNLFLVHGEYESQKKFAKKLEEDGFKDVDIPELGQTHILGWD